MTGGSSAAPAPRRRRRRAWRALRAIAALCVLALLALWYVLESDTTAERLRQELESRGSAALGGTVSIGSIDLNLLPFHLELRDASVQGPERPLAEIDRLDIDLSPWGLLQRRVVITNLELDRPRLAFDTGGDPDSSLSGAPRPAMQIDLRRVRINDGELRVRNGVAGIDGELTGVFVQLAPESAGLLTSSRAPTIGELRIGGGRLDLTGRNGAAAVLEPIIVDAAFAIDRRVIEIDRYSATIGDSRLDGRGTMRGLVNAELAVQGDVALADIFKVWVPPGPDDHAGRARFFGNLELRDAAPVLTGRLTASDARMSGVPIRSFACDFLLHAQEISLRNVRGRSYGGTIDGDLVVDRTARPSRVHIEYRAAGVDVAALTSWALLDGWRLSGSLNGRGNLGWAAPFAATASGEGELELSLPDANTIAVAAATRPREHPQESVIGVRHAIPSLPLPVEAAFRYRLAAGTLQVEDSSLQLPGSSLDVNGRLDMDGTVLLGARLRSDDLRMFDHLAAQYRRFRGSGSERRLGLRGNGSGDLRVGGTVRAPIVSGTLNAAQLGTGDLEIGTLVATLSTSGAGDLTARPLLLQYGNGRAEGSARVRLPAAAYPGGPAQPDYDVQLTLQRYRLQGALDLGASQHVLGGALSGELRLGGRFGRPTTGEFDVLLAEPRLGALELDSMSARGRRAEEIWLLDSLDARGLGGTFTAAGLFAPGDERVVLDATARAVDVAGLARALQLAPPVSGRLDLDLQLEGRFEELNGELEATWNESRLGRWPLGTVVAAARADRGVIGARVQGSMTDATTRRPSVPRTTTPGTAPALLPTPPGGWTAAATLGTRAPGPLALDLRSDASIALAILEQLQTPLPESLSVSGLLDLHLAGDLSRTRGWQGQLAIAGLRLDHAGYIAAADRFTAVLEGDRIATDIVVQAGAEPLAIAATYDLAAGALGGTVRGGLELALLRLWQPQLEISGSIDTNVALRGTLSRPLLQGTATAAGLALDGGWAYPLSNAAADLELNGAQIVLRRLDGLIAGSPFRGGGRLPLTQLTGDTGTPAELQLVIDSLPLEPLLSRSPAISTLVNGGEIGGGLSIRGDLGDWRGFAGELDIAMLHLAMRDYRLDLDTAVQATLAGGTVTIPPGTELAGGRTALRVSGTVGVAPLQIDLATEGELGLEPLNVLSPVWGTGGIAALDLRIFGAAPDLAYRGTAALRDVVLSPPPLRQPIEDISANLTFEDRRVRLDDVEGELGGGQVAASGELFLRDSLPQSFRIAASVDNALLRIERDVRVELSASLVHDGTPQRSLLSGDVTLVEGLYRRELQTDDALLEMLESPETDPNPLLSAVALDVHVQGSDNLFVDNNLADVEVTADFDLRGTLATPVVLGRSRLLGGRLFWNGNTFEVLQGTVEFNNPFETEPVFEIQSRTEIRRYTIDLSFSGSLRRGVAFNYTSTPSLSDLDLFNLLAFGQDPDSAVLQDPYSYQRALGLQATRYLADAYLTEVERGAERVFGVDRFRISPTLSGQETDATARLTLGKRINRNLYVTYSRLLSSSEDQLLTVEYQLTPEIRVKGTRDEDGSFGIDFLVQKRIR